MIVATSIASLSFLSLLTFETAAIRNFGLFTALGILSALAIEMTLIPAVRCLLPVPTLRERTREGTHHMFDPIIAGLRSFTRGRRRVGRLGSGRADRVRGGARRFARGRRFELSTAVLSRIRRSVATIER